MSTVASQNMAHTNRAAFLASQSIACMTHLLWQMFRKMVELLVRFLITLSGMSYITELYDDHSVLQTAPRRDAGDV